eukprot:CAMPEP_0117647952 /NCGR_PEP_ID=MMETSP0804-20121206/124_1 /TAXON_ID=1074897 /ORGANISM="Tetraselmis astigmatica, Strain CCMP880" /LENGTH=448 /DNA_ID=CAMNT_0005453479 /DNA_START=644 /DNA_END=1990 /DNA_ORIENTATION=+
MQDIQSSWTKKAMATFEVEPRDFVSLPPTCESKLTAVMEKLERGEEVVVAVVGGSMQAGAMRVGHTNVYAGRLVQQLRGRFPAANISFINGARGSTTSATTGFCLEPMIGSKVDLMFLSFTLNDFCVHGSITIPYERLLRQALTQYPASAIIAVGFWSYSMVYGAPLYSLHRQLAAHYGIGWFAADPLAQYLNQKGMSSIPMISRDTMHPTLKMHSLMAEMLFQQAVAAMEKRAVGSGGQNGELTGLPAPLNTPHELLLGPASPHPAASPTCDISGLPQTSGNEKLERVVYMQGWEYMTFGKATPERLDRQVCLVVPPVPFPEGNRLVVDVDLRSRLLLAECAMLITRLSQGGDKRCNATAASPVPSNLHHTVSFSASDLAAGGTPWRVFDHESGEEIKMEPWIKGGFTKHPELWVSAAPLAAGTHRIRVEAQQGWCPRVALQAVIGI